MSSIRIILSYLFLQACLRFDEYMEWDYEWYFRCQLIFNACHLYLNSVPERIGRKISINHSLPMENYLFTGYLTCIFGLIFSSIHTRLQICIGLGTYLAVVSELPDFFIEPL